MVSAREEPDAKLSPAMDALLKVHFRIDADSDVMISGSASTRLLVAAAQAGSLIGRQGATIKSIQDATGATVRVLPPGKFVRRFNVGFNVGFRGTSELCIARRSSCGDSW